MSSNNRRTFTVAHKTRDYMLVLQTRECKNAIACLPTFKIGPTYKPANLAKDRPLALAHACKEAILFYRSTGKPIVLLGTDNVHTLVTIDNDNITFQPYQGAI